MKNKILSLCFMLITFAVHSQVVTKWARGIGSSQEDNANGVAVDNNGNVYVAGAFTGIFDFGGGNVLTASGLQDAYLAKYNQTGLCVWVKSFSGDNDDMALDVHISSAGSIYVSGSFQSSVLSLPNSKTLINNGSKDIFIAKLDQSGTCIWANSYGYAGSDEGAYAITTDLSENVYVAGEFIDSIDFNLGKIISKGVRDIFVLKLNSIGSAVWARNFGDWGNDHANDIAIDNAGNLFVVGYIEYIVNFDGNSLVTNGSTYSDGFLIKLDPLGNCSWAKGFGGTLDDYAKSVYVNELNEVFISGSFSGTADFSGGKIMTSIADHDIVFAKYDNAGTCIWAKNFGKANINAGYDLTGSISKQEVVMAGSYNDSIVFSTKYKAYSKGLSDAFVAGFDYSGVCKWSAFSGSVADDYAFSNTYFSNSVYYVGDASGNIDFANISINNQGGTDAFIAKVSPVGYIVDDTLIMCLKDSVTLQSSSATSYVWSDGSLLQVNKVSPSTSSWFKLTVNDGIVVDYDSVYVKVNNLPVPLISAINPCIGDSLILACNLANMTSYSWTGPLAFFDTTQIAKIKSATLLMDGSYNLTVIDSNNCQAIIDKVITVNTLPTANAGNDVSICIGNSVSLTASGGKTNKWNGNISADTLVIKPSVTSEYVLTAIDSNNCKDNDTVIVTINDLPTASLTANHSICAGVNDTLLVTGNGSNYKWSNDSTGAQVIIKLLTTTNFKVTITDINVCSNVDSVLVTVYPATTANAGSDLVLCNGSSVALSASGGTSYAWNTLALTDTSTINPTVTSTYTVTANNIAGCSSSDEIVVTLIQRPVALASKGGSVCEGISKQLKVNGGNTYIWSTNETDSIINVTPNVTTSYKVIVTALNGCTDDTSVVVTVIAGKADFIATIDTIGLTGIFTNKSTGQINEYSWSFSDGNASNTESPNHSFAYSGVYTVKLTANDTTNNCLYEQSQDIKVGSNLVKAEYTYTIDESTSLLTINSASTSDIYFWNFGDGTTSTQKLPTHTYTYDGVFNVCLTAYNTLTWAMDTKCNDIAIGAKQVIASFASFTNLANNTVSFNNVSQGIGNQWYWEFGDGTVSYDEHPVVTYSSSGDFNVCLTVRDSITKKQHSNCRNVTVGSSLLTADFTYVYDSFSKTVKVKDNSLGAPATWFWDFGDRTIGMNSSATHTYTSDDVYNVCLSVNNAKNKPSTICHNVVVGNSEVVADFSYFVKGNNVYLQNESTGIDSTNYWSFGDGVASSQKSPEHTYATSGVYDVCLNVRNSYLDKASLVCKSIQIGDSICNAEFDYIVNNQNRTVVFADKSIGGATKLFWNLGDENTLTGDNPIHQYIDSGHYAVTLVAENLITGCKSDITKDIQIGAIVCKAGYTYSIDPKSNTVWFKNTSVGTNVSYYWDFNDDYNSSEIEPGHTYFKSGMYRPVLIIENSANGCLDKFSESIILNDVSCEAAFVYGIDSTSNNVTFESKPLGSATKSYWEFGDANDSYTSKTSHTYKQPGYYLIKHTVYDASTNCMDTKEQVILVSSKGKDCEADFIFTQDFNTKTISLTNTSLNKNVSSFWHYGDSLKGQGINVSHQYAKSGYYAVCLNIEDPITHCKNMKCETVNISADINLPSARFIYAIENDKHKVGFKDVSDGKPIKWDWDFGDGLKETKQNVNHTFTKDGWYIVVLEVKNSSDDVSRYLELIPIGDITKKLKVDFGYISDSAFKTKGVLPVEFKGVDYGEASEVEWDFGDGTKDNGTMAPIHNYSTPGTYTVCVTAYDNMTGDTSKSCKQVVVEKPQGIEDVVIERGEFYLYPNPARNELTVVSSDTVRSRSAQGLLTITNSLGQVVLSNSLNRLFVNPSTIKLNISALPNGLYFISINGVVKKFVVSK